MNDYYWVRDARDNAWGPYKAMIDVLDQVREGDTEEHILKRLADCWDWDERGPDWGMLRRRYAEWVSWQEGGGAVQ
ncbi:hypothetical protein [Mycolicibacterium sp.]|uniref:hypothetical protein n=1 Tax=Mycolicibacterium sp. TaxID=2320850 RepID=UPI003560C878